MMYAYSIISYFHVKVTKCVIKKARLYVLSLVTASCILTTHNVLFIKCALGLYNYDCRNNDKNENTFRPLQNDCFGSYLYSNFMFWKIDFSEAIK